MNEVAVLTIALAFLFTFTNGFQDASSVAATFIASRSATPRKGIVFVALCDFLGALFGGSAVAFTISGLLSLEPGARFLSVIFTGILTATGWNLVTWWRGLPSSSTHGLIGGLIGAGVACGGIGSVNWGFHELLSPSMQIGGVLKVLLFLYLSVLLGLAAGYAMRSVSKIVLRNARRGINSTIVRLNWCAAALMAFSNGANDSQKQLGIIALVLFSSGITAGVVVPPWARVTCAALLGAGTLSGGWRIMTTIGRKIFRLEPVHSLDSQVSSGAILTISTVAGAPVSSTHVISSSVIGVGAAENPRKVYWDVGREILLVMALTIPATMFIGYGLSYLLLPILGGS
ncbi:MAG: inorganic phosphate transporter [Methanolinea sp.]|nr:inorganic phosphate transporter [Methanolinea sp.]